MSNTMLYKNYAGSVEFSEEDGLFYGKVLGIRSLISFEGTTAKETAFKGSFNVRTTPEIHRKAAIYAINHHESLNSFVTEALKEKLAETE